MQAADSLKTVHRSLFVALALMLIAAAMAWVLTPRHFLADDLVPVLMDEVAPVQIGEWRVDPDQVPVLADPQVQAKMDAIYSQSVARTYVNNKGQRVMLSLAYGRDQNSESTAAHRPEFCYVAQGFMITKVGARPMSLPTGGPVAMRLIATEGRRMEPITYWVTLGDQATLPGFKRKLLQLQYGLRGDIADGMLVRLSSIGSDQEAQFKLQEAFARDWYVATRGPLKSRIFGS